MYLKEGIKFKTLGKILAVAFAVALMINLLIAAGVHTGALVDNLAQLNINRWASSIAAIILVL